LPPESRGLNAVNPINGWCFYKTDMRLKEANSTTPTNPADPN